MAKHVVVVIKPLMVVNTLISKFPKGNSDHLIIAKLNNEHTYTLLYMFSDSVKT